jgi:MoxR-like ATPase
VDEGSLRRPEVTGEGHADPSGLLDGLPRRIELFQKKVETVIVGQRETVDAITCALLSRGHCLLVGVPGLGKTLLVNTVSRLLGLKFSRIQFTPDLMPSDITGTDILEEDVGTGRRRFVFVPGPVFTHVLLADEINRTPPKTQAALLEAMQERTVSVAGQIHRLREPFLVLATQNPIEQEGTYPLPEAQLDRFLFQLTLVYPTLDEERRVVEQHSFSPLEGLEPLWSQEDLLGIREAVARIPAARSVVELAVRLVRSTRPDDPTSPAYVKNGVRWGASPRASQNLVIAARSRAAIRGRFHVSEEDVLAVAPWVLCHRIIRSFAAEAEGLKAGDIVQRLIGELRA